MGEHIDYRSKKKKIKEHDAGARRNRVTFKSYLRALEEELLDEELEDQLHEDDGLNKDQDE